MTLVTFRRISDKDIQNYLETEEFIDKAGAYAIQGEGAILIDHIVGDYLNIVGLSLNAVLFLLNEIKVQSTL
jgi:septum formation protein